MKALRLAQCLFWLAAAGPVTAAGVKPPTFNRDVEPILFTQCAECHHAGGIGPFSLTTYAEARKRAQTIARVTASRYMPPWLPEPGHGAFQGERRLTPEQITLLRRWAEAGAPEGARADLAVRPAWSNDWQLGPPDLILTMPQPYTLPAEGADEYRNFVIPVPEGLDRDIRAVEIRPGNARVVHHITLLTDTTGDARERARREAQPGFRGMNAGRGAKAPEGHFEAWQPGKRVLPEPGETTWKLHAQSDVVLQMHLRPDGKAEPVQASVGLYFAPRPSPHPLFSLLLRSTEIDLPAGSRGVAVEASYRLPVEVDLLGVWPHLHYLGDEVHGWAELPGGATRELIYIPHWDFNWQGDYRYQTPLALPAGTVLHLRHTYDNTAENPRNPSHPPRRVRYGPETSDEMGELSFQLLPRRDADYQVLSRDYEQVFALPDNLGYARAMLRRNPRDAESRTTLAETLYLLRRPTEAEREARTAADDDLLLARPHLLLGHLCAERNDLAAARRELARAAELDPKNPEAVGDYGYVLLLTGDPARAVELLERALALSPGDGLVRANLQKARAALSPR